MNVSIKKIISSMLLLLLCVSLAACANNNNDGSEKVNGSAGTGDGKEVVRIGTMPENEALVELFRGEVEDLGYEMEVVMFSANQLPATALKDGDIDGVILNQKMWVDKFNEGNNSQLHVVEPYIFYVRATLFSEKYDSLDELPQNAKIAIPGDPTNMERALEGLEKAGLFTLGEKKEEFYSLMDIEDNPKNIEFIETERGTTARAIKDVDAVLCGLVEARQAGIDVSKFLYDDFVNYPHGLIVQSEKNASLDWARAIVDYSKTDKFAKELFSHYERTLAPWEDQ